MDQSYTPTGPYERHRSLDRHMPNVVVPPIDYSYADGQPKMVLPDPHKDHLWYKDDRFGDPDFRRQLAAATKPTNLSSKALAWKFDMRRQAQAILPFLYLGPSSVMKDTAFLDSTGVTYLLAIRDSNSIRGRPRYLNPDSSPAAIGRQTATFDIENTHGFLRCIKKPIKDLLEYLQTNTATPFTSAEDIRAKVLVCCETGNDRSAAFVAGFLMTIYGLTAFEAMQVVHSQRFSTAIGDDNRRILVTYAELLTAERETMKAHETMPLLFSRFPSNKRTRKVYDDNTDEEMIDSDSPTGTEEGRSGVAPFKDVSG
jgi:serine/threonine/tyrosine-interacting protein